MMRLQATTEVPEAVRIRVFVYRRLLAGDAYRRNKDRMIPLFGDLRRWCITT